MKQKISTKDLQIGMFVEELDRPWLETHFLFQGFRVMNQEDLESLKELSSYVYIDDEKGDEFVPEKRKSGSNAVEEVTKDIEEMMEMCKRQLREVEDEIKKAHAVHRLVQNSLTSIYEDMRMGRAVSVSEMKIAVNEMIQNIVRDPNAMILLGRMEQSGNDTAVHAINCAILALSVGRQQQLSNQELESLGLAALLHDVGETAIPREVLDPTTKKSAEDVKLIRRHPEFGRDLLSKIDGMPASVAEAAYSHHERADGKGYPRGLQSDEISYYAKLISIIDVYEWVTSGASGKTLSSSEAIRYIYGRRGTVFDKDCVEQFIQTLGIYPVGSLVELARGDVGVVVSVPEDAHLNPRLILILDPDKQPYYPARLINLSHFSSGEHADDYVIVKVLPRNAYGFDLKAYMQREMGLAQENHAPA